MSPVPEMGGVLWEKWEVRWGMMSESGIVPRSTIILSQNGLTVSGSNCHLCHYVTSFNSKISTKTRHSIFCLYIIYRIESDCREILMCRFFLFFVVLFYFILFKFVVLFYIIL